MRIQEVGRVGRDVFLEILFQSIIKKLASLSNSLVAQRNILKKGGIYIWNINCEASWEEVSLCILS